MKGNSLAMKLKEWGYINGRMGGSIKESGRRIKCMGKGKLHGIKNMKVKIADFGLADIIKKGEILQTRCGTPGHFFL